MKLAKRRFIIFSARKDNVQVALRQLWYKGRIKTGGGLSICSRKQCGVRK